MNKILIVDDTSDVRDTIRLHMEVEGYEVEEAKNGIEGLEQVAIFHPDIILLDHHMPDMTGLSMLKKLRETDTETQVVILTADPNQIVAVQALRDGANDFIPKPFDSDFLKIVVKRTLTTIQMEKKLRDSKIAKQAAEQASHLKSRFLENIQHETRSPTGDIDGFLWIVKKRIKAGEIEKGLEYLDKIRQSSNRLMNLVNRILDLSKLQAGEEGYTRSQKKVIEPIDFAISNMRKEAKKKGIQIKVNVQNNLTAWLDVFRIKQVITELLNNAIQFSQQDGIVHVQAEKKDDFAHIYITDTGCGIPDSELERIFTPFDLSSRTDTGAKGQGLGLAICHQIIMDHNGTIQAKQNDEGGTKIIFTIPIQKQ